MQKCQPAEGNLERGSWASEPGLSHGAHRPKPTPFPKRVTATDCPLPISRTASCLTRRRMGTFRAEVQARDGERGPRTD